MTYSKDWRAYPPAFVALLETAAVTAQRIQCASAKDAKRLEGKLHAFFGVLHRNAKEDPSLIPLDNQARRVKVKAVDSTLEVGPRDAEPDNILILRHLGQAPAPTGPDALAGIPVSAEMQKMFDQALTTPKSDV